MSPISRLFQIFAIVLITAAGLAAQNAPAAGDTLPALQAEVAREIKKHGTYNADTSNYWISRVEFEGCRMAFEQRREYSTSYASGSGSTTSTTTSFDLGEIDPSDISLRLVDSSKMRGLRLPTIDKAEIVSVQVESRFREPSLSLERSALIVVRQNRAEILKQKLVAIIRLCQQWADAVETR